ncbi:MAG TPA: bifunctional riboflavin kinase/FAD synthetase [Rubrobacteraceae bacterium]|jgi:riboflavin kinase/FMN adenylyltransferase|nr:bifunctional riboflavin kinase/FAD synthetase [Rubrobacteraceae bacterium]
MRGVVIALGTFDGVHLGHQVVIRRAAEEGRKRGLRVGVVTFDPHPQAVLRPGSELKLLTTLEVRKEILLACGVDEVHVMRFDENLSKKNPEEFVREVLVGKFKAAVVVVGENFRFGHKASGNIEDLRRHMRETGGEAYAVPIYACLGESINSTKIRALVAGGEVREAARLLGRPYSLRGKVVVGDKRGRVIGFPTANVLPDACSLVPGRGVYVGHVWAEAERYGACTNVGVAPTFDQRDSRVEAHLLDYQGDLYGRVVEVTFVERLRPEKRFFGADELKEQIARDIVEARKILREDA